MDATLQEIVQSNRSAFNVDLETKKRLWIEAVLQESETGYRATPLYVQKGIILFPYTKDEKPSNHRDAHLHLCHEYETIAHPVIVQLSWTEGNYLWFADIGRTKGLIQKWYGTKRGDKLIGELKEGLDAIRFGTYSGKVILSEDPADYFHDEGISFRLNCIDKGHRPVPTKRLVQYFDGTGPNNSYAYVSDSRIPWRNLEEISLPREPGEHITISHAKLMKEIHERFDVPYTQIGRGKSGN